MDKLSPTQRSALDRLTDLRKRGVSWLLPSEAGYTWQTLQSLSKLGLIEKNNERIGDVYRMVFRGKEQE